MIAVIIFIILFVVGIILGNLFPACVSTGIFGTCNDTQFNLALTIFFWFSSFLICLFFYSIGHIIGLLSEINAKLLPKRNKK